MLGEKRLPANAMHLMEYSPSRGWTKPLPSNWEDGTIACWGLNNHGQSNAPDGVFIQIAQAIPLTRLTSRWHDRMLG